jgi:hypothetical protein
MIERSWRPAQQQRDADREVDEPDADLLEGLRVQWKFQGRPMNRRPSG